MRKPVFFLMLLVGLLSGCMRWCERHYTPPMEARHTHTETRDSTIRLPGASISAVLLGHLHKDVRTTTKSIMTVPYPPFLLPSHTGAGGGPIGDHPAPLPTAARPAILSDTTGRAQLQYWYDEAGNLHIDCKCNPIPYTIRDAIRSTMDELTRVRTVIARGFWWWSGIVAWCLAGLFVLYRAYQFVPKPLRPF